MALYWKIQKINSCFRFVLLKRKEDFSQGVLKVSFKETSPKNYLLFGYIIILLEISYIYFCLKKIKMIICSPYTYLRIESISN